MSLRFPKRQSKCPHCKQRLPRKATPAEKRTAAAKKEGAAARRAASAELRAAVLMRVVDQGQRCECGCGRSLPVWGGELDHWSGGSGRRKAEESAATCWMLTLKCHAMRTRNSPSAAFWNEKRGVFCERYGYPFTPHIEHAQLPGRAAR
jgi:hypothetical protein